MPDDTPAGSAPALGFSITSNIHDRAQIATGGRIDFHLFEPHGGELDEPRRDLLPIHLYDQGALGPPLSGLEPAAL